MEKYPHHPVLLEEVLTVFRGKTLHHFCDGTLGAGGHASVILEEHPEIRSYIAFDQDFEAMEIAKERLEKWGEKVEFISQNFEELDQFVTQGSLQGMLLDLGISSMHIDRPHRGFSFRFDSPLDMRMDVNQTLTAKEVINRWPERKLGEIFREYGEVPSWKKVARAIAQERQKRVIETTGDLLKVIQPVARSPRGRKIHPATLIFQAIRICVNRELEVLEKTLPKAINCLAVGGLLVVISFHRLEDRLVKQAFRFAAKEGVGKIITPKPLVPPEKEMRQLPRSRSAKMRVLEKI